MVHHGAFHSPLSRDTKGREGAGVGLGWARGATVGAGVGMAGGMGASVPSRAARCATRPLTVSPCMSAISASCAQVSSGRRIERTDVGGLGMSEL